MLDYFLLLGGVAITSVAAVVAPGLTVTPRIEARRQRIQQAYADRDTFNRNLMVILCACARLRGLQLPPTDDPDCTPSVRERLVGERRRWMQQIDDATRWMADNVERFAGGWPTEQLRDVPAAYAAHARMLWLSDRDDHLKIEQLAELTAPVQAMYFRYVWHRARHTLAHRAAFTAMVDRITAVDQGGADRGVLDGGTGA
ncbi:hypothetical protein [Streptomyces synnematoformans]|uniref:Uncharacterized protein n=1 Tax=Streptomyces synnematoformans TaxID=415721 RepID=A0ABP5IXK7_9ACTN